jgi:hypothetical protein
MYCYVWPYVVRPACLQTFRIAYGPKGDWVQLFRCDPEHIRTHLLSDHNDSARFMTIDYWSSEACVAFRERFYGEFEALDKRFEQLTLEEVHLGDFDV